LGLVPPSEGTASRTAGPLTCNPSRNVRAASCAASISIPAWHALRVSAETACEIMH
jgi:hypothetical protein